MMKKILLIFITLLFINTVSAGYGVEGDYGGGAVKLDEDASFHKTSWPRPYVAGIRITFVDSSGKQIGSGDYIVDDDYESMDISTTDFYYNGEASSRLKYNGSSAKFNKTGKVENFAYKLSSIQNKIDRQGYFSINLDNAVNKRDFDGIFDDLARDKHLDSSYEEKVKEFFKFLIPDFNFDFYFEQLKNNLFITFEPTTVVKINGKYYYGTNYELYTFALGQPASGDWGTSKDAVGDLASVFLKMMPCTTYLDGSLAEKMKNVLGTSDMLLLSKFTKESYFGNKLKIYPDTSDANYICETNYRDKKVRFKRNEVSNYALSMGVLWLGEYLEAGSCDAINAANPNLVSNLDTIFKNGGSMELLKQEVLKYKNPTTNEKIDPEWYINECTCYGIYFAYDNYIENTYKKNNQSTIDTVPALRSDWLDIPNLFDTKGWVIKKYFNNNVFTPYNERIKNISNVTTWDYNKYVSLNCPTFEDTSNTYWCDDFEKWYDEHRPSGYSNIDYVKKRIYQYEEQFNEMVNAYNLVFYPATGFKWSLDESVNVDYTRNGTTVFSYVEYCLGNKEVEQPSSYNCTPKYNVGNCEDNENITYKDSSDGLIDDEYWNNCVFNDNGFYDDIYPHKTSTGELSYKANNLGSDYCEVYCIETLDAFLPEGNISVEVGRYFTWDTGSITGSRTCKTKSIEYDTFLDDLETANDEAVEAYIDWQLAIKWQKSIDNATSEENACSRKTNIISVTSIIEDGKCRGNCNKDPDRDICEEATSESCGENCTEYTKKCYNIENGTKYTANSVTVSVSVDGSEKTKTHPSTDWCEWSSKPKANIAAKKNNYYSALTEINGIISSMKKCYDFNEEYIYKVDPIVSFEYSDGTYSANGQFDINIKYDDLTENDDCVIETVDKVTCSDDTCRYNEASISKCTFKEAGRKADITLTLPDNLYMYINKDETISSGTITNTNRYTKMDFSSFPVAYATEDGWYGIGQGKGILNATYTNLGHISNSADTSTDIDKILKEMGDYGKWECKYEAYTNLITNRGINLVYRTIDLKNPFPDIDGNNRNTGSNWCDNEGNCSYDNLVVKDVITNNRGVKDNEVYDKEAMYTFILTPSDIVEIRKYNKNNTYSSYTGSLNNTAYDYKCNNTNAREGKTCISDYLTKLIDIGDATGACTAKKYRTFNDQANFEYCRYK